jgi:hypothetical protein
VVDDALLGGYEVALDRNLARGYGIRRTAYLLVKPRGPVDGLRRGAERRGAATPEPPLSQATRTK